MTWVLQKQEKEGTYAFSGNIYMTRSVQEEIPFETVQKIIATIHDLVIEQGGLDYLQVFVNEKGQKLFFIDNLNEAMLKSGDYGKENNYATLMFAHEY
jgi:hypothetical protein